MPTPAFFAIDERLSAKDLAVLIMLSGVLFFTSLGARDLWNPNEPIYGQAVVEMARDGTWLIPSVNGEVFAEKPILYYWLALASAKVFGGVNEATLRVPSALAGTASILLTALLVVPYAGRRRALLAALVMATQYQVFWAARSVQMDVLVLVFTIGALLPLTRMLDFGLRPAVAWSLAGLSLGLGFAAKGPVSVLLPGLAIASYALYRGVFRQLLRKELLLGALVGVVVASPWYLVLWSRGETDFLIEVLFRQNFTRFVDAWDHQQPWWYYLKYTFLDYAPWSLLLPAVLLHQFGPSGRERDAKETSLDWLCWLWICSIVLFFSLSESKRAPYILPVAPALAILIAGFVKRWMAGVDVGRWARRTGAAAFGLVGFAFLVAGAVLLSGRVEIPAELMSVARGTGIALAAGGAAISVSLLIPRLSRTTPAALWFAMAILFWAASVFVLPRVDDTKSARAFATEMKSIVEGAGGQVVSVGLWQWRAGYVYYSQLQIPILPDAEALATFWTEAEEPFLLMEERKGTQCSIPPPGNYEVALEQTIGGRTATLFRRTAPKPSSD